MFAKYCYQDYLKACQGLLQPAKYIICLLESVYDMKSKTVQHVAAKQNKTNNQN